MTIIDIRIINSGKFLNTVEIDNKQDNGNIKTWEAINRNGTGNVVGALVENITAGCFVLVEQFRPAVNAKVLELVAGLVDEGNTIEEAITKEIREETGYVAKNIDFLLKGPKSPGMSNEYSYDYYVEVEGEKQEQELEGSEIGLEIIEVRNKITELIKLCEIKEKQGIMISPGIWAAIGKALTMGKVNL